MEALGCRDGRERRVPVPLRRGHVRADGVRRPEAVLPDQRRRHDERPPARQADEDEARAVRLLDGGVRRGPGAADRRGPSPPPAEYVRGLEDRKSTRLNSSHPSISYAVFCLKKKKKT